MVLAEAAKYISLLSFSSAIIIIIYLFCLEGGLLKKLPSVGFGISPKIGYVLRRIKGTFLQKPSVRLLLQITLMVISTRLVLFLIGYLAIVMFRNESGSFLSTLEWIWNKWDAGHLLDIAKHGYVKDGEMKFFIVFYPLYPLMVRLFAFITRNYVWAGFLVSHLSLIISCYYLFKLVELDKDEKTAGRTIKFLLIFPQSFFLNIVHTDSLFLATSIFCFYYLRKQKWLWAGFCGCLAALTRNFGILLLVPALMEYLKERQVIQNMIKRDYRTLFKDFFPGKGYGLFLISAGLLIYLIINKTVTGDWLTFLRYQSEHWHNNFGFFGENLKNYTNNCFSWSPSHRVTLWIPEVLGIFFVIGLILYGFNKIRLSYIGYMLVYIFVCSSATWLISGFRYILGLFPVYILLAIATQNKICDKIVTFTLIMLLGFYTIAFVMDFPVM